MSKYSIIIKIALFSQYASHCMETAKLPEILAGSMENMEKRRGNKVFKGCSKIKSAIYNSTVQTKKIV